MEDIEANKNYEDLSHDDSNYEGVEYIEEGDEHQEVYLESTSVEQVDPDMCFLMTDGSQIFQIPQLPQNSMPLTTKDLFFLVSGSDCIQEPDEPVKEATREKVVINGEEFQPMSHNPAEHSAEMAVISKLLCLKCNISCKNTEEFLNHNILNHRDLYMCGICGVGFNKVQRLKNHAVSHVVDKPFKCDICGKTFSRRTTLNDHNYLFHEAGERAESCNICKQKIRPYTTSHQCFGFKCPHCTKYLKTQPNLASHIENCHTLPRHQCPCCFKNFTRASGLKDHLLAHENKRKFLCSKCSFGSNTAAQLKRHEKIHTPEHWYDCTKCSRRYATSSGLRNHKIRRHSQSEDNKITSKDKSSYKLRVRKHKTKKIPSRMSTRRSTKSSSVQTVRSSERSKMTQTTDTYILSEVTIDSTPLQDNAILNSAMLSDRILSNRLSPVSEETPTDFMAVETTLGEEFLGGGAII